LANVVYSLYHWESRRPFTGPDVFIKIFADGLGKSYLRYCLAFAQSVETRHSRATMKV
jgi:hypothetical protein